MSLEKIRPTAGETVGKGSGPDNYQSDCIAEARLCQGPVEAALRALGAVGRCNAVTREQVARAIGLSSQDGSRTVSKLLEREREKAVICSSGSGLFVPEDSEKGDLEVVAYIAEVTRKGAGSFRSIRGARRYIERRKCEKSGQLHIGGEHE